MYKTIAVVKMLCHMRQFVVSWQWFISEANFSTEFLKYTQMQLCVCQFLQ